METNIRRHALALVATATILALGACGGGGGSEAPVAQATAAEPADPGARTQAGRYATREQAEQADRALGERLIRVRLGCCGSEAVDVAVGMAFGLQAAHDLPRDVPVFVDAADLRLGAAAVNRLQAAGFSQVWLVTP